MKLNYQNEDYKSVLVNIVVYIIILVFVIIVYTCTCFSDNSVDIIGYTFFIGIFFILPLLILLLVAIKSYIKRKEQRNLNLFIIQNGEKIEGKIISIYDNYTPMLEGPGIHNFTVEISYGEKKIVIVDHLCIGIRHLKKCQNKTINIYVYNNMSYIDIAN